MPVRVFSKDEKEKLKQKMLEAGLPLLKSYGMTHMSIARITDTAGIAASTFYHFWSGKEEYVADLVEFQEQRIIAEIMPEGSRKPGKEEVREFLKAMVDPSRSIIPWLSLKDESDIFEHTNAFMPDEKKESDKTVSLLSQVNGVRRDINPVLIANLVKVLALTAESKKELHASAYDATIDSLVGNILNQIFYAK